MKSIFILLFLLVCTSPFISGGDIHITATPIGEDLKIDGQMNEPLWQLAVPFSRFRMVEPEEDQSPTEATEVRVLYSKNHLYIGILCHDSSPNKITSKTLDHDSRENDSDLVRILLDPFQDKRNAYVFFVNARGGRSDGLAFGEHYSLNWDGIWDAKSRIHEHGWTTEIKIPFKTISFNPRLRAWGLNLERYIPRKQETIRLSGISQNAHFYNPAEAGLLQGLEGIKQGLGLTFQPYAKASSKREYASELDREYVIDGGFDLRKNITPNLVGVISYNTDFAETEVDDRQVNLTRFDLYFPEKRSFFLEGSEIFNFGTGLHRAFAPFFSRRIGLLEEEEAIVPINYGAKAFGKIGNTNLSLLGVRTRDTDLTDAKSYFAGRVYQNILSESKVGMIFTSGNPDDDAPNHLFGLDFLYNTSKLWGDKNFSAGAWWVYNWNGLDTGSHHGYGFRLDYPNDLFDVSVIYHYFGDALEPGLSYLPRNAIRSLKGRLSYQPRPKNGLTGKWIRQFFLEAFYSFYWDLDGNIETIRLFLSPLNVKFESGDKFEFNIIPARDVLPEEFEVSDGIVIPIADYSFTRYKFEFESAPHRTLGLNLSYEFGDFYSGRLNQLDVGASLKYKGHFKLGVETVFVNADLAEGSFKENLYRLKTDLYLNADLGLLSYIQYDDASRSLGANIRLRWRISPGNIIYLVYNSNWERSWDPATRFSLSENGAVFKIQISWRP